MATKRTATRSTRTKAQVQAEFTAVRNEARSAVAVPPSEAVARNTRNNAVKAATADISVEKILTALTTLGLSVQESLSTVGNEITATVRQLEELRDAVELEKKALEELYKIDVAKASVELIVTEYDQRQKELEERYAKRTAELQAELNQLNADIAETRENAHKARVREEEEYNYDLAQRRRKAEDEFNETMRLKEREATEKEEYRNKRLYERETALAEREAKIGDLEKQVAEIPALVEKAEKKGAAITQHQLDKEYGHKIQLLQMEAANDAKVAAQKIESLEGTIADLENMVGDLRAELTAANARAEKIAAKALEASSGRQALEVATTLSAQQQAMQGNKR